MHTRTAVPRILPRTTGLSFTLAMKMLQTEAPQRLFRCVSVVFLSFALTGSRANGAEEKKDTAGDQNPRRAVTVADVIRMSRLGDRLATWNGNIALFSPNRKKFVVVLKRGNPDLNTNEYSLLLWNSETVLVSSAPEILLVMSSSSNRPAIEEITWLADNETVMFLGEHPGERHQLYSFNVRNRTLAKLTNHPTNLIWYSVTPRANTIAYTAEGPIQPVFDRNARQHGVVVSAEDFFTFIDQTTGIGAASYPRLFLKSPGHPAARLPVTGRIPDCCTNNISLSPDGAYVAIALNPKEIPEEWKEYSEPFIRIASRERLSPGAYTDLLTYALIDTRTGRNQLLLNAPVNSNGWQLSWSPNSEAVVIGGAYLPLGGTSGSERETRRSSVFAAEIKVPGGDFVTITGNKVKLVDWDRGTGCVVFRADDSTKGHEQRHTLTFCKEGGRWWQSRSVATEELQPEITLHQSMNAPPTLYATDPRTGQTKLLLNLNPQFDEMRFGRVEEIRWKLKGEGEAKGGLYYPIHYDSGERYPLVIQTHGWDPDVFWIDGPFTTAFAAQPLAGKGMMVLQVDDDMKGFETPKEAEENVAMIEGAIDYLDRRQLIDRDRVGIIGFSRSCLYVKYALGHSNYHFAAASVTDGFDGGYLQYLLSLPVGGSLAETAEAINGGSPFGSGLKSWMDYSTSFHIDRVRTPLRINALNPEDALGEWEWFAAMSRLSEPVEMAVTEHGSHLLERPWDRMISLQGNVDWFAFWLKGDEDSDPDKARQYARWRELSRILSRHDHATSDAEHIW